MNTATFAKPTAMTLASDTLVTAALLIGRGLSRIGHGLTTQHHSSRDLRVAKLELATKADDRARLRVREANEVRDMAVQLQFTQPGFAGDLFAAADRHEREGGVRS